MSAPPSALSPSLLPLSVCLFVRLQLIFIKFANGKFILLQLRRLLLPLFLLLLVVVAVGGRSAYRENFYLNDFQIMLVLLLLQPRLHASTPCTPPQLVVFYLSARPSPIFYVSTFSSMFSMGVCVCVWVFVCVSVLHLAFSLQLFHLSTIIKFSRCGCYPKNRQSFVSSFDFRLRNYAGMLLFLPRHKV